MHIQDLEPGHRVVVITFPEILQEGARLFGVTKTEILSKGRSKTVARARNAVALVARECLKSSFPELGRYMGSRDHTTLMSSVGSARALMQEDSHFRQRVEELFAFVREKEATGHRPKMRVSP